MMIFGSINTVNEQHQLRFVQHLNHPREQVWGALVHPDQRANWFFAGSLPTTVGDEVRLIDSGAGIRGTVLQSMPGRLLEFTWNSADEPGGVVRFELSDVEIGTSLVLTHTTSQGRMGKLLSSWHRTVFDDLPQYLDDSEVTEKPGLWQALHDDHYVPLAAAALNAQARQEKQTLTLIREVNAEIATVYRAFTDPNALAQWWWPHLTDSRYTVDPVVGGDWRIESVSAGIGVHGTFTAVDPLERLAFTFIWMNDGHDEKNSGGPDEVEVRFATLANEATSLVQVSHRSNRPLNFTEGVGQGWQDVLDRLGQIR